MHILTAFSQNIFSMAANETAINELTMGKPFSFVGKTNLTHQSVSPLLLLLLIVLGR